MDNKEFLQIREDSGMSQQAMAVKLDKSLTTIRAWEKGRVKIDPLYADGIKYRLGILSNGK